MNTIAFFTAVLTLWIGVGLIAAVWMIRRGHDVIWLLVAVVLGPLFVPIALERAERGSRLARSGPGGPPMPRMNPPAGPRILIGMDGSPESDQALSVALKLFGKTCELFVLAEVVCYEATETISHAVLDAASARLTASVTDLESRSVNVSFEVLAGPPGKTLRCFAEQQDIDLIVVGRRGRGLTNRVMGSVSADLVQHSPVPVLIAEPSGITTRCPETTGVAS